MNSHEHRDTTEPAEPTVLDSQDHGWLIVDPNAPGGVRELTAAEDAALAEEIRAGTPRREGDDRNVNGWDVADGPDVGLDGESGDPGETGEMVERAHWAVTHCGPARDPAAAGRRGEAARRDELADHLTNSRPEPASSVSWADGPAERTDGDS